MSNYVFKRSDPANGTFLVQPNQIDGHVKPWNAALYVNPVTGLAAISSNTSLVLAGQGITEYGELVQNSLLYLMEHFAYATRPLSPTQGQIWYKNTSVADPTYPSDPITAGLYKWTGTFWATILAETSAGVIDGKNLRITNVGAATNPADVVNVQFGDSRYLQLTGGNITGPVTVALGTNLSLASFPVLPDHATNKLYVDTQTVNASVALNAETAAREAADAVLTTNLTTVSNQLPGFVQIAGSTMSGPLILGANASLIVMSGGGVIDVGSRKIEQVGTPTLDTDATTKLYVDQAISTAVSGIGGGPTAADGVISGGDISPITGVITLTRTLGLPDIVLTGSAAPSSHAHSAAVITYDLTQQYNLSTLALTGNLNPSYPQISTFVAIRDIDQKVTEATQPVKRKIIIANGTTATLAIAPTKYTVGENRLQVYANGIKQYANERGSSSIEFVGNPLAPNSLLGTSAGIKTFTIAVDGNGPQLISVTISLTDTFYTLINAIRAALASNVVQCDLSLQQTFSGVVLVFNSNTVGTGSSVTISYNPGELFTSIPTSTTPTNTAIANTLGYTEDGPYGEPSSTITMTTIPPAGMVFEFIVFPG